MGNVKVTIDGRELRARKGMTILEAAEKVDVNIPTLCHRPDLSPTGVCRICVVEVEGAPRLVGACHTPVSDGAVIFTRSSKVMASRRATLELMLAGHTGPCVTDSRIDQCELNRIASELELGPPRFQVKTPRFYPVEEISPYVRRDLSKCILCRRCVRACEEIAKKDVYGIGYRGFDSKIIADCDDPLNKEVCRGCGICIDYCPTSALARPAHWAESEEGHGISSDTGGQETLKGKDRHRLLGMLKEEQRKSGFVSPDAVRDISRHLNITLSNVYGVTTFYSFLSTSLLGRNIIRICKSLPCSMKNGSMVIDSVQETVGIRPGETSADGRFSFELTNCIGACDRAPAMLVNDDVHGNLTPNKISEILKAYS